MAFIPLFAQSHFSPLGTASCAELARRARALGYPALGLCDEATMAGYQDFDEACQAQGIRPIFGCRIVIDGLVVPNRRYPLEFLIESEQGYRSLVRILTQYHDLKEKEANLPRKLSLKGRTAGLWVILPPDGELAELVMRERTEEIETYTKLALEYFRPQLAIGVEAPRPAVPDPSALPAEDVSAGEAIDAGQRLRELAEFIKVPCLAAPRFFMAEPGEAPIFEILKNPQGPAERGWKPPENEKNCPCLFSEAEIVARFPEGDDAVHESGEIARRCSWRPTVNRRIIPVQDFERGFDPNSFLFDLVIRGAAERYGEIGDQVKNQINREFEEIKNRNLAPFLLLYRQITNYLDEEKIPRGVGRGVTVASILAYCLGITRLDPIQYRLAYQPLAGERETFPSIRVEIPSNAAPKVIQWLKSTFGESHLAQIGRWHELRREQMIEELARWAGMTEDETRMAMEEKSRRRAPGAAQRLREEAESRNWKRWRNPGFLSDLATRMSPRPKALVPAAGRWTISAEPLEYVFPSLRLQGSTGRVTDIGEAAIDRLGGPRVEFVPHHLLNLLDRARAGAMGTGAGEDFQQLAMEDRATFELISRGDTLGIPPLESITVKSLLRKHRPVNILQLMKIKTDANKGRPSDKHKDLTDELPDMLLSVQLAYFKVHHSHAFYAAGLSSAAEIGEDLSILVREIRRRGIEVLPPDINLSGPLCTVFRGKIRLGLLMIRHLGEKALEEILSVRLGGGFNSLAEFCSGVSSRAVNLRVLQNLISAGAFDRFDQSRARMSSIITKLNRKHNNFTNEHGSHDGVQATLFDLSDMDQGPSREDHGLGEEPTWDFLTRVRREEEALGFNLMVDTMSKFPKTIEALRPIEADTVTHRYAGKLVKVIGLIDGVETDGPFIGDEVGAIIDVDGLAVSLNPRLAKVCGPVLRRGERAMALGEVNVTDGFTRVDALGVWRLRDLEEQSSKVARVRLCLRGENRTTLKHLIAVCKLYQGGTELELVDYPSGRGFTYRILARQRVFFCSPFFQGLCKILPMNQIELYAANGELLSIATAREKDSENS